MHKKELKSLLIKIFVIVVVLVMVLTGFIVMFY